MNFTRAPLRALLALSVVLTAPAFAQQAPALTQLERQFQTGAPVLQRIAVVIGNGNYRAVPPLRNTINDARAMAALLRENGFRVLDGYDLDKQATEKLLRDAVMAGGQRSDMVVFFAGHGVQIADRNYLLPVDARLTDPNDLPFQTVSLDRLLEMLKTQSGSQVAVLDSCRNNPFEGSAAAIGMRGTSAPIQRGFSQPRPPSGSLLAFSTAPGALALDGQGANSPYTGALVAAARLSGDSDLGSVLTAVKRIVEDSTGGQQSPTFSSALSRPFTLRPPPFAPMLVSEPTMSSIGSTSAPVSAGVISAPTAAVFASGGGGYAGSAQPEGDIVAPRERIIAIGTRLLQRLNLDGSSIVLGPPPPNTSYGLASANGDIIDAPTGAIRSANLGNLVLRLDAVAARDVSRDTGIVTHPLTFKRLDPGGYRTARALTISIVPNACDVEAGDWFDPQGVGVHRLDKAVRADTAISACTRSLQADPSNARFRYQLGRGYQAAGQAAQAEGLYRDAANGGHIRAWVGYGKTLEARGDLNAADAAYLRGSDAGDPRATASLGKLRLRNARSDAERDAAYDLLTEGIDLGLWTSMEAVSDYLTATGGDGSRAARFVAEAQSRRDGVDGATVSTSGSTLRPKLTPIPEPTRDEPNGGGERQ